MESSTRLQTSTVNRMVENFFRPKRGGMIGATSVRPTALRRTAMTKHTCTHRESNQHSTLAFLSPTAIGRREEHREKGGFERAWKSLRARAALRAETRAPAATAHDHLHCTSLNTRWQWSTGTEEYNTSS